MRLTKTASERIHTKRRALERFGIKLTTQDIKRIVREIQSGKWPFISRDSARVSKWRVRLGENDVCVVYDKNRKNLVTVMPMDYVLSDQLDDIHTSLINLNDNNLEDPNLPLALDNLQEKLISVHKLMIELLK